MDKPTKKAQSQNNCTGWVGTPIAEHLPSEKTSKGNRIGIKRGKQFKFHALQIQF